MGQIEAYLRAGEGDPRELRDYMLEFYIVRFEELAPCRHIVEQVSYGYIATLRRGHFGAGGDFRSGDIHFEAGFVLFPAGAEADLGHGGNRSERLAPEAVGEYVAEVFRTAQLAGRVSLEADHRVVGAHPAAVVNELYECPSGILHRQGNGTRAGIHGILHQFLDYGSGTLDHLAGGYHIGKVAW